MNKQQYGFTLIELLVVVLIIGILAAVALPQYQKAVEKARMTEAINVLSTLEKAVDIYILEHGMPSIEHGIDFFATTEVLSIHFTLPCTQTEEEDGYCYSKHYAYFASCTATCYAEDDCSPTRCFVGAERINDAIRENEENPFLLSSPTLISRRSTTGKWEHVCGSSHYFSNRDILKNICKTTWEN